MLEALLPLRAPLAFGLRLWASVGLALFVAFWLQMDNPFWAATSAGIVCQPSLGASLRKASFRLIGTMLGAIAVVGFVAAFPQSRAGFLLTLAIWCGLCGFAATVLQNFASYAAALAGYTAAIVAADAIANPNAVFLLAVARASEICLGIVCAGVVLTLTGRGTARARAATVIATITREAGLGMRATLLGAGTPLPESAPRRRALIARTAALSALLDEVVGESPDLRVRSATLQAAVDGLFQALSGWRMVATHLESAEPDAAAADAAPTIAVLPPGPAMVMSAEAKPADTRDRCRETARQLVRTHVDTAGAALVAAGAADCLLGLERALNGLALLVQPQRAEIRPGSAGLRLPDLLPAIINGLRAGLIVLVLAGLWIITAWPSGPTALLFGAIVVLLLSPRGDTAISNAWGFLAGTLFTAAMAAIADFALLPAQEGFVRLFLVMGLFLVPLAALSAQNWQKSFFVAAATNFTPLLAPANLQSYDTVGFYNTTIAIVGGVGIGVLVMAMLPQLSPAHAVARLRSLTLRDLGRLATTRRPGSQRRWERLLYARIGALPASASPRDRSEMVAALFVGEAILRLRQLVGRWGGDAEIADVLSALARRRPEAAGRALEVVDADIAARADPAGGLHGSLLRARAATLAMREVLVRHSDYFGAADSKDGAGGAGAP
jgi:uncharacterized membrane protein YccC